MYIEDQIGAMRQQPVEKPFGWLICFEDRPLQATPPGGQGAHLLVFSSQAGAAAFIAGRQRTLAGEPLSSLVLPSAETLKDLTILPSRDPRYVVPPCGLILDFNSATGASRQVIPPALIESKIPAELARELGLATAAAPASGPVVSRPRPVSSRKTATILLASLGGAACLFLCVVVVIVGAVGMKNGTIPSMGLFNTATFTPLPTFTPSPTRPPTPTATPIVWDVNVTDDFSYNANDWSVYTDNRSDYIKDSASIQDGVLHWQMEALQGVFAWNNPDLIAVGDFDAAIDAQRLEGSDGDYGLIFRLLDNNNYYMFVVDDYSQTFFVGSYQSNWSTIVDWTTSKAIQPGQVNHMGVSARGDHFVFSINGINVTETDIHGISLGKVGVAIDMYTAGDLQTVNFDNFELHGKNR